MSALILVVNDEPDVEAPFGQQFRKETRVARYPIVFARSAEEALASVPSAEADAIVLILSEHGPGK